MISGSRSRGRVPPPDLSRVAPVHTAVEHPKDLQEDVARRLADIVSSIVDRTRVGMTGARDEGAAHTRQGDVTPQR